MLIFNYTVTPLLFPLLCIPIYLTIWITVLKQIPETLLNSGLKEGPMPNLLHVNTKVAGDPQISQAGPLYPSYLRST